MQAKKCDRCGTLYEIYNASDNPKKCNGLRLLNIKEDQTYHEQTIMDLCPKCMTEFMSWRYAAKNKKEE